MSRLIDLSGQRCGQWTVLRRAGEAVRYKSWVCKCDCGIQKVVNGQSLRRGLSRSCGFHSMNPMRKEAIAKKEKKYFTGQPCVKGHIAERWTLNTCCVECSRTKSRAYYNKNRGQILERARLATAVNGVGRVYELILGARSCSKCNLTTNPFRYGSRICRPCESDQQLLRYKKNDVALGIKRRAKTKQRRQSDGFEACRVCGKVLPLTSFVKCSRSAFGRTTECRACATSRARASVARSHRKSVDELSDRYVRYLLSRQTGLKPAYVPDALLQDKRNQVSIFRSIIEARNVIKQKS